MYNEFKVQVQIKRRNARHVLNGAFSLFRFYYLLDSASVIRFAFAFVCGEVASLCCHRRLMAAAEARCTYKQVYVYVNKTRLATTKRSLEIIYGQVQWRCRYSCIDKLH